MISTVPLKITFLLTFQVVPTSLKFFQSEKKELHRSGKNFTIVGKTSLPWEKLHRLLRSFLMKFFQPPCTTASSTPMCCGEYPNRFKFNSRGGERACCRQVTYNTKKRECCSNSFLGSIGSCQ